MAAVAVAAAATRVYAGLKRAIGAVYDGVVRDYVPPPIRSAWFRAKRVCLPRRSPRDEAVQLLMETMDYDVCSAHEFLDDTSSIVPREAFIGFMRGFYRVAEREPARLALPTVVAGLDIIGRRMAVFGAGVGPDFVFNNATMFPRDRSMPNVYARIVLPMMDVNAVSERSGRSGLECAVFSQAHDWPFETLASLASKETLARPGLLQSAMEARNLKALRALLVYAHEDGSGVSIPDDLRCNVYSDPPGARAAAEEINQALEDCRAARRRYKERICFVLADALSWGVNNPLIPLILGLNNVCVFR